ncbi:enoyl-CoA hydratase/isomerase family protein [Sinomonas sp. P47F7]|uniref:enoyl-CoA hydratase/isomerase family protein n=1 Tax=Sinomonas sp. P47F7 TaxID=3410987 RepID=UPI003BF5328C
MSLLETTRRGLIEQWSMNRPQARNALNPDLVSELHYALKDAEASTTRVVVLSGRGLSFCAGADLRYLHECALTDLSPRPFLESICALTVAMEQSPILFVAALNGHAVAGGFELALACDLVVAAKGALVGDGHVRNNLVPGGGASVRIQRRLGAARGAWLALSGELVAAESLVPSGWIHAATEPEDLLPTALGVADRLASVPQAAQASYKRLLNGPADAIEAGLARELDNFEQHWADNDIATHLRQFLREKEPLND